MTNHEHAIFYIERGTIERGPRYQWRMGYSENGPDGGALYPWMTWTECQADAKARGKRAVFLRPASAPDSKGSAGHACAKEATGTATTP